MQMITDTRLSEKQERIASAAMALFLRDGLRATSMEAIAAEAGCAKATLYGVYKNKQEVFAAVAEAFASQLVDEVRNALDHPGTVEERITAGLCAKQQLAFDVIYASPHAPELIGAKTSYANKCIQIADEGIVRLLENVLKSDPATAPGARVSAQALFFASIGIADHTDTKKTAFRRIEELTMTYLTGVRARGRIKK
jgi:AcrR family transcriptional regulator